MPIGSFLNIFRPPGQFPEPLRKRKALDEDQRPIMRTPSFVPDSNALSAPAEQARPMLRMADNMPNLPTGVGEPAGMDLSGRGVPIPQLPGRPGGPIPYSDREKARYDYVMKGAKRDAEGNLAHDESGKLPFKRSGKDILLNTLLGFGQGMASGQGIGGGVGGAIAGALGSTFNPMAAREQLFDVAYAPRMKEQEAQQLEEQAREQAWAEQQAKLAEMRRKGETEAAKAKRETEESAFEQALKKSEEERRQARETRDTEKHKYEMQKPYYAPPRPASQPIRPLPENVPGYLTPEGRYEPNPGYRGIKAEKEAAAPSEARKRMNELDDMKAAAMEAWDTAKGMPEGEERDAALITAQSLQSQYNEAVSQFGQNYSEFFETGKQEYGKGKKPWAYYKPRKRSQASAGGMAGSTGAVRNLNDLLPLLQ